MTKTINVAIAGIGNCASSLIQGLEYYHGKKGEEGFISGIAHNTICGYSIRDIRIVAAFDVAANKVGKDLSQAIFMPPNNASRFCKVSKKGIIVQRGPLLDGLGAYLTSQIHVDSNQTVVDAAEVLKRSNADILINFLPTGSKLASEYYANAAIKAGCGFINAIPEAIANDPSMVKRFDNTGLPLMGDDLKSQLGATIIHRALVDLFVKRGGKIDRSYQLNAGGNMDFYNLSDAARVKSKLITKNVAIKSLIPYDPGDIVDRPTYVNSLGSTKICYISIEGKIFGDTPVTVDVKLSVEDPPNAAGVMIDLIRFMRVAMDRKLSGVIDDVCAYFFKDPPMKIPDDDAYRALKSFISGGM